MTVCGIKNTEAPPTATLHERRDLPTHPSALFAVAEREHCTAPPSHQILAVGPHGDHERAEDAPRAQELGAVLGVWVEVGAPG